MSRALSHPVVGELIPYGTALAEVDPILGTPFDEFVTSTVRGLAWVRGSRLDLLVITAAHEGRGDGGRFLADCMAAYDTIGVWEIYNDRLTAMLTRRGFRPVVEILDGDSTKGMRWDRPSAESASDAIEQVTR